MNDHQFPEDLKSRLRQIKSEYASIQCPPHLKPVHKAPKKNLAKRFLWLAAAAVIFLSILLPVLDRDSHLNFPNSGGTAFGHIPTLPIPPSGIPAITPDLSQAHRNISRLGDIPNLTIRIPSPPTMNQVLNNSQSMKELPQ